MNSAFNQKKVSVIIPTYNRAKFIPNAVRSIINQKYNNLEIIIVDDGSNDNTQAVVNALKQKYSNIIYCHNKRTKGPSGARNTGIIKSSGDYVSFLDSDDTWLDGNLSNGLKVLNKYPEIDVLFGNYSIVDFDTGKHQYNFFDQQRILHTLKSVQLSSGIKLLKDNLFKALIQENFFSFGTSIIRKSSTIGILIDESVTFSEDRDFVIKLYKKANATFAFREDPVFIAYKHDSNLYMSKEPNKAFQIIEAHLYLFIKYLRIYNLSSQEKRILTKLIAERLSNLSYLYGKNKEYKNALSSMLKSFKYGLTFRQLINIMKVSITFLIPDVYVTKIRSSGNRINKNVKTQILKKVLDNYIAMFNYKRFVRKVLYYTGVPYLIVRLLYFIVYCFRNTPGTLILCYHSINDLNNSKIFNPNIVGAENFLKQMKFLRKYYNVLSLEYFIKNRKKLTGRRDVIITFDDGYKDNFTVAYPVLKKYKLPATIFLATDCIDTGKAKFEDIITYLFSVNNVTTIDLDSLRLKKALNTKNERDAVLAKICYTLNKLDIDKSKEVINELCTKYNIESGRLNDIMLTWDEIRNIDRKLITFGSHSISHQNLTKLSHNQQVNEITKSKSVIESQLKSLVTGFSYPLGFSDNNVINILKEAGYKYAITTIPGVNNGDIDFFKLKRISAVNNFHLFKFQLICQPGTLYNMYSKLARLLV